MGSPAEGAHVAGRAQPVAVEGSKSGDKIGGDARHRKRLTCANILDESSRIQVGWLRWLTFLGDSPAPSMPSRSPLLLFLYHSQLLFC